MFGTPKNNEISIVELAVKLNLSVRRIHEIAKELGKELKPDAKFIELDLTKKIEKFLDDELEAIMAKREKEKNVLKKEKVETVKSEKKIEKVVAEKKVKDAQVSVETKRETDKLNGKRKIFDKIKVKVVAKKTSKEEIKKITNISKNAAKKLETLKISDLDLEKNKKIEKKKVDTSVADELLGVKESQAKPKEVAEIYDEVISQEIEREIVHSQRKKMAGKDQVKKEVKKEVKKKLEEQKVREYDPNRIIEIGDVISVKEFAEKSGVSAAKIIGELMKNGILANINQIIDYETTAIIAEDLGIKIKKKLSTASAQELSSGNLAALLKDDEVSEMESRAPIVVVMGHVDHGKTSLLDAIRKTDVVAKESGGITQHIGAYQVEHHGKKITFLDTPGHEAFTAMRARGAQVTDVAILVVAADEGIKPQTIEALQHARDAKVPIIVAINKIDKPGADVERVKGELAGHELTPEDWGGNTIMVPISAKSGEGIERLLEMILLVAEMENLKANPKRKAIATVIEAHRDPNFGPVATVIVNAGTLRNMDAVVVGSTFGKIKVMKDCHGKAVKEAIPSTPVLLAGFEEVPIAGDILQVVENEKMAREKAIAILNIRQVHTLEGNGVMDLVSQLASGKMKQLKIVLKADTLGTLEAIKYTLGQIKHDDLGVKVILAGVGAVNESDVLMASASEAIVVAFKVNIGLPVKAIAEREKVDVFKYDVIYKLNEDVKKILSGLLEPEIVEVIHGRAKVLKIFMKEKTEMIIGCKVINGSVLNKDKIRVFRDGQLIGQGVVNSLKKGSESVNEIKDGNECGIRFGGNLTIVGNDELEFFNMEKKIRTF